MGAAIRPFGTTSDGRKVEAVTLAKGALSATILTYGAALQDVRLAGTPWPLTLGANTPTAYEGPFRWFGCIVGPVANRIAGAQARIGGRIRRFEANERGRTTLHGGSTGTHAQVWRIEEASAVSLTLGLDLPDGLGGFPGNRGLRADFAIGDAATLTLRLSATTDAPTILNLANHSYWNLDGTSTTAGHRLTIRAGRYLPTDADSIPLAPLPVGGTAFDFRAEQSLVGAGPLDHTFCLADRPRELAEAAILTGAKGVRMVLSTTAPGLQVYDGAGIATRPVPGLTGEPYGPKAGLALEPQHWPDAAGRPDFPPIGLLPGESWRQDTEFAFSRSGG